MSAMGSIPTPSARQPIYLDHAATTAVDPRVVEAMLPHFSASYGNPSSLYRLAAEAKGAVDHSRATVAEILGARPGEIVFTSCGTESDNLALRGAALAARARGNHIITSQIEHPAVLNTCRYLEKRGYKVTYLPVDETGRVDPEAVERAVTSETVLVSIMQANNETGTLQPIAHISDIARRLGILVHTDAAQSVGKVAIRVEELGVDLLTVAGHKLYAPKGVGSLYVRHGTRLEPLIHGAGHEDGRRAGTENVPYMVGLGTACLVAERAMGEYMPRIGSLRDRLHELLTRQVPGLALNGHPTQRLPNTLNVSFPGVDGEELLAATPEVAASTGSACHAGRTEPSGVLTAMGLPRDRALGAIRLSLGKFTTGEEVERAAAALVASWRRLSAGGAG